MEVEGSESGGGGGALCESVSHYKNEHNTVYFNLEFEAVNTAAYKDLLEAEGDNGKKKIDDIVLDVLREAADEIDLTRIKSLIELAKRMHLQKLEANPHDAHMDFILSEFLFGPGFARNAGADGKKPGDALIDNMQRLERFDRLLAYTQDDWRKLLFTWFIDNKRVTVVGEPSKSKSKQLQDDEEKRLAKQKAEFQAAGKLEAFTKELKEAEDANEVDIPVSVLNEVKPCDLTKIEAIPVKSYHAAPAATHTKTKNGGDAAVPNAVPASEDLKLKSETILAQIDVI